MEDIKDGHPELDGRAPNSSSTTEASSSKQPATADSSADMAPSGKLRPNTPKRDVDLSSLLNVAEKAELVTFVSKATDTMQKHITQVFDSTGIDDSANILRPSLWPRLPFHLRDMSLTAPPQKRHESRSFTGQKENRKPSSAQYAASYGSSLTSASDAPPQEEEEEQRQTPRLQELKKEVLLHFKKWQAAVHKRVGDISVKRTNEPQVGSSSYGSVRRGRGFDRNNKPRGKSPIHHMDRLV